MDIILGERGAIKEPLSKYDWLPAEFSNSGDYEIGVTSIYVQVKY